MGCELCKYLSHKNNKKNTPTINNYPLEQIKEPPPLPLNITYSNNNNNIDKIEIQPNEVVIPQEEGSEDDEWVDI